jgi:hypothetical protein
LGESGIEYVVSEPAHDAGLLGETDELGRREKPANWMLPADQRFDLADVARFKVQFRLVVQHQLRSANRVTQFANCLEALACVAVARALVDRIARMSRLGLVHRDVGVLKQRLGVRAVLGVYGDADARDDPHVDPVHAQATVKCLTHATPDFFYSNGAGEQGCEFITADAR